MILASPSSLAALSLRSGADAEDYQLQSEQRRLNKVKLSVGNVVMNMSGLQRLVVSLHLYLETISFKLSHLNSGMGTRSPGGASGCEVRFKITFIEQIQKGE
ncbi:hypothetical protein CHARACLAT_031466 [Characodon lateralis]|uniref:Uncharacterized protein n=1 Tax=Characodon lateralis TaxID=208331 RepID=A0ABU7DYY8_9TELE|nr:hypothetical protein [Characodon lateralis]